MKNTIFAGLPDPSTYQGYDLTHPDPSHLKPVISQWLRENHGGLTDALTGKTLDPSMIAGFNKELGLDPSSGDALKFLDSESLGYSGDEFVHGAPVGHGLLPGQYDPSADSEVFWGSHTPQGGAPASGASQLPPANHPLQQFLLNESHLSGGQTPGELAGATIPEPGAGAGSSAVDPNQILAPYDDELRQELLRQLSGKGVD